MSSLPVLSIVFVIAGQFLNAVVALLDRFVVKKKIVATPFIYATYVSLLSLFVLVLLPFGGITLPAAEFLIPYGLTAFTFFLSIYLLFESLTSADPAEVVPVIGSIGAITTFLGNAIVLHEPLPSHFALGFVFLVFGMALVSHFAFSKRILWSMVSSGIFFGISMVLIKYIFQHDTFLNSFFWSRIANVLVALAFLLLPGMWRLIRKDNHKGTAAEPKGSRRTKILLITANKVLGGLAFVCVLAAIKFGNVAMVNALAALQYLFLIIFSVLLSRRFPEYFKEPNHHYEVLHKVIAAGLILIGFIILFL